MIYKQGNLLSFVLVSIVERAQEAFSVLVPGGKGGHLGILWVGMCRPGLQIILAPRSKKNFPQN